MSSINVCVFSGNVGRDPEMRYTPSGQPVTNFSIAVSRKYTTNDGEKHEETLWPKFTAWGKLAEVINQYVKKGDFCVIHGSLKAPEAWLSSNGEAKGASAFSVVSIEFKGNKHEAAGNEQQQYAEPASEEDIPF